MSEMKENVKIGLLGVIALTLMVNTYLISTRKKAAPETVTPQSTAVNPPANNTLPTANDPNQTTTFVNPGENIQTGTPAPAGKMTRMAFTEYLHDFGTVKQNSTNKFQFRFTNTGDEPLVISNAVGSCGCTVPDYPKEPIAPGKTATINVEYKPGMQSGSQEKKVTVTANTDPGTTTLTIKANVVPE